MLAISDCDVFTLLNGIMQRYPKHKQPVVYYGVSSYFATANQPTKAIVLDSVVSFNNVSPEPFRGVVSSTGEIAWDAIDAYVNLKSKALPIYSLQRVNVIDEILAKAVNNNNHALSAMLSNFTPAARTLVKSKVIDFLTNPKVKKFVLPVELQPKRGRAVAYYEAATNADYSELKAEIAKETPGFYEARYWRSVIRKAMPHRY